MHGISTPALDTAVQERSPALGHLIAGVMRQVNKQLQHCKRVNRRFQLERLSMFAPCMPVAQCEVRSERQQSAPVVEAW